MTDAPPPRTWRQRVTSWARELVVLLVLGSVAVGVFGWLRGPKLPDAAPAFTLSDLSGGKLSLDQLRGKVVVVNFWATWCTPCLAELPMLTNFAEAHPDMVVVGVAVDEPGPVRARVERSQIRYPVVIGTQAVVDAYGVSAFPTTVVVDAEGQVRWSHTGLLFRPHLEAITWWAGL